MYGPSRLLEAKLRRRPARQLGAGRLGGTPARSAAISAAVSSVGTVSRLRQRLPHGGRIRRPAVRFERIFTTIWQASASTMLSSRSANREFDHGSTCAFDTNQNAGLIVNDTIASGGTIDLAGWEASTLTGHGIVIESWINGDVEIRGQGLQQLRLGRVCSDTTTHVLFPSATAINNNGTTPAGQHHLHDLAGRQRRPRLGSRGGGRDDQHHDRRPPPFGNSAGAYNANTGACQPSRCSAATAPFAAPSDVNARRANARALGLNVNQAGGGNSPSSVPSENQNRRVFPRLNPSGNLFRLNDKTSGTAVSWLSLTSGAAMRRLG